MVRDRVNLELRQAIAILTFNNPRNRNALDGETWNQFFGRLKEVASDETIRAVIVTGRGEAFVAGADISELRGRTARGAIEASRRGHEILLFLENLQCPVIAAINGWALGGGCELALACDLRIASERARIGQPEINLGIIPGYGASIRLPRLIGVGRAKEMIFTGRIVDSAEAEKIGLVNRVVPHQRLMDEAIRLAEGFATGPAALRFAKEAINQAQVPGPRELMERDMTCYRRVYETEDQQEGLKAFLEKRRPLFKGG